MEHSDEGFQILCCDSDSDAASSQASVRNVERYKSQSLYFKSVPQSQAPQAPPQTSAVPQFLLVTSRNRISMYRLLNGVATRTY
jgi:hypothetical protein